MYICHTLSISSKKAFLRGSAVSPNLFSRAASFRAATPCHHGISERIQ